MIGNHIVFLGFINQLRLRKLGTSRCMVFEHIFLHHWKELGIRVSTILDFHQVEIAGSRSIFSLPDEFRLLYPMTIFFSFIPLSYYCLFFVIAWPIYFWVPIVTWRLTCLFRFRGPIFPGGYNSVIATAERSLKKKLRSSQKKIAYTETRAIFLGLPHCNFWVSHVLFLVYHILGFTTCF